MRPIEREVRRGEAPEALLVCRWASRRAVEREELPDHEGVGQRLPAKAGSLSLGLRRGGAPRCHRLRPRGREPAEEHHRAAPRHGRFPADGPRRAPKLSGRCLTCGAAFDEGLAYWETTPETTAAVLRTALAAQGCEHVRGEELSPEVLAATLALELLAGLGEAL